MTRVLIASPIDVLAPWVTGAFENPNGSAVVELRRSIDAGLLEREIEVDNEAAAPKGPSAVEARDGRLARIRLQTAHLEHLWTFIYAWLVLYEEAVQKPMIAGTFTGAIEYNSVLTQRAARLLQWGEGLRDQYSSWPSDLPTPSSAVGEEGFYADKVNSIYLMAVAFLLHHEYAHIRQGHFAYRGFAFSEDERASRRAIEREADEFAFSALIAQQDGESLRRLKGWAVLAPPLAWLHLVHTPKGLFPTTHPIAHQRIGETLSRLNYFSEEDRFYFSYLASIVLGQVQTRLTGKPRRQREFETAEEALQAVLDELDALESSD